MVCGRRGAVVKRWLLETDRRGVTNAAGAGKGAGMTKRIAFLACPATQPVNHVTPGGPPALLLTAANDITVGPRNATSMEAALSRAGIAAEHRTYPGIAHIGILTALARPLRGRAPVLSDAAAFAHKVTATP